MRHRGRCHASLLVSDWAKACTFSNTTDLRGRTSHDTCGYVIGLLAYCHSLVAPPFRVCHALVPRNTRVCALVQAREQSYPVTLYAGYY